MKKALPLMALGFVLTACVSQSEPIVTDFNGDSVKISQTNYFGEGARSDATDAEANRICKTRNRTAEFASQRILPNYIYEYLYLCN